MPAQIDLKELHWLLDIVQCLDVGVVVLDRQCRIEVWNSFMENHSGLGPDQVHGRELFEVFPEIVRRATRLCTPMRIASGTAPPGRSNA